MPWLKKPRAPGVEDLTSLLDPAWTGGQVTAVRSPGGAVTILANSLTRAESATGTMPLLTLPPGLRPVEHLYGVTTFRGKRVRCLTSGVLSIDDPASILDYVAVTYVPRGGA